MISYELPPPVDYDAIEASDRLSPVENSQSIATRPEEKPTTIGCATALYDFEARFDDELPVSMGEYVQVLQRYDDWVMARNPVTRMSGLIPVSYLQLLLDNAHASSSTSTTPNPFEPAQYDVAPTEDFDAKDEIDQAGRDSGNNSLGSSTAAENEVQQTKETLDDFIELFGLKPKQTSPQEIKQAPARPPPPKNRPVQPIRNAPVRSAFNSNNGGSPEWSQKFLKIVEELLNSEILYSTELNVWEQCVTQSTQLNEQQKCILTNGYPMLQDLSQLLIRSLADQLDRKPEHQSYGQMFMEIHSKVTRTYAYYFRCIIEITQFIENREDKVTHDALQECLKQMRDSGVFVFDVTTAVVRPINRCLKYPLFIDELLKVLPLTHIDHPKLLEAKKQMKNLVAKMNESKRRKELVKKSWENNQETSIASKLSKLNMHSLRKKSKKLVSSIGLTGTPKQN